MIHVYQDIYFLKLTHILVRVVILLSWMVSFRALAAVPVESGFTGML